MDWRKITHLLPYQQVADEFKVKLQCAISVIESAWTDWEEVKPADSTWKDDSDARQEDRPEQDMVIAGRIMRQLSISRWLPQKRDLIWQFEERDTVMKAISGYRSYRDWISGRLQERKFAEI